MNPAIDFIVMGAGIIGLSAAIAVRQRGYTVVVLESGALPPPKDNENSRVYALNQASQTLLQDLGVWDTLPPSCLAPYDRMHVWDTHGGAKIRFDARTLARDRLGVILEETYLKEALLQQARVLEIDLVTQWKTEHVETHDDGVTVSAADQQWSAEYLIVAEGGRSSTRDLLRIPMTTWSYHQHAIVAKVSVEQPHMRTAYQAFCPQGPLAFLPLAEAHSCSIVWSTAVAHAETLMVLSDEAFDHALTSAFEQTLGVTRLLSQRQVFPLQMRHVKQYAGPRWLLMGDAAHTLHPLAGLGLNLGLSDLAVFLQRLRRSQRPTARDLRAYHRHRQHALWQMILLMQGLHLLFTDTHLPIKMVRGLGLKICDQLPMIKRMLIAQASGVTA